MKKILICGSVMIFAWIFSPTDVSAEDVFDKTVGLINNQAFHVPLPGDPNNGVLGVILWEEGEIDARICDPSLNQVVGQK